MHMTWPEIVAALARLGSSSPRVPPGLHDRVMHRLFLDGTLPLATRSPHTAPSQPDAAARHGAPTETIELIADD